VLGNLISNALRYAQSGKKIVLGATEQPHQVEFYVRDFGPGIPSEHLPRIFERFYRVDKPAPAKPEAQASDWPS